MDGMDRLWGSPIGGLTEEEPMQAASYGGFSPAVASDSCRSMPS